MTIPARCLVLLVRLYQITLSPLIGGQCRYRPTCSEYAIDALHEYGAARGSWLAFRRILRCHPWGGSGYDPVKNVKETETDSDQQSSGCGCSTGPSEPERERSV